MKVSIVTPNYNGLKFLPLYFSSLLTNYDHIEEIIVVDNNSSDNSLDYIHNLIDDGYEIPIRIIENMQNFGFAKAVNQGIKASKSEYVFLLNNDIEMENNTISNLIGCIESREDIFSVSSKMIQFDNRDLIDDAGDEYTILANTKKTGFNQPTNKYTNSRDIFSSCAGAALYKKSVFQEIGYFEEEFFAYMEDVELAYRSRIYGYRNYFCPDAIVYHIGSGTTGSQYNEFKVKISARNNIWLIYKDFPMPQKIVNFIFYFIGFSIKYLFFRRKGFGEIYLDGIKEGLNNRNKIKKTDFKKSNTLNYFKIELRLFKNLFKLIKK